MLIIFLAIVLQTWMSNGSSSFNINVTEYQRLRSQLQSQLPEQDPARPLPWNRPPPNKKPFALVKNELSLTHETIQELIDKGVFVKDEHVNCDFCYRQVSPPQLPSDDNDFYFAHQKLEDESQAQLEAPQLPNDEVNDFYDALQKLDDESQDQLEAQQSPSDDNDFYLAHQKLEDESEAALESQTCYQSKNGNMRIVMCNQCCETHWAVKSYEFMETIYPIGYTITSNLIGYMALNMDHNFVISPFTIDLPLSIAFAGSSGNTAQQLSNLAHAPSITDMLNTYKNIVNDYWIVNHESDVFNDNSIPIYLKKPTLQIMTASKLWVAPHLMNMIKPSYLSIITSGTKDGAMQIDSIASKDVINKWISDATKGKITNLMDEDPDQNSTVLTSATYFKAEYQDKFSKGCTSKAPFYTNIDLINTTDITQSVQCDLMSGLKTVEYSKNILHNREFEMIKLNYVSSKYLKASLVIVKPLTKHAWNHPLSNDELFNMDYFSVNQKMHIRFPKFKFEEKTELKDVLSGLGLTDAFMYGVADFSGIINNELFIGDVIHQATIEIDEEGAVATAATAFNTLFGALCSNRPVTYPIFMVNRPFHAYIIDETHRVVLFFAMIQDPTK